MNFSVHLSLAFPNSQLMAGQYLADFLDKKGADNIHEQIKPGILMHRWLDHYSNNHTSLSTMNKYLHGSVGKYAPVASDIICDYLLFKSWSNYFAISYEEYIEEVYLQLSKHIDKFPDDVLNIYNAMRDGNWLMQYSSIHGLEYVFNRMNKKARFKVDFNHSIMILRTNETRFLQLFNEFYEDAIIQSRQWHEQ